MLLSTIFAALLIIQSTNAQTVVIRCKPPFIEFSLPLYDKSIGKVTFHYEVKNAAHQAKGYRTAEGWEYRTSDIQLDRDSAVYAYADIYDVPGNFILSTDRSFLTLDNCVPEIQQPSRYVRGAAYFRDDFNSFNGGNWKYEVSMYGGYNGEFQVYTNDNKNVFTRDGHLHIHPIPTVNDNRFSESFLHTGVMDLTSLFGYCTEPALNGCHRDGHDGILPPVMSGKLKSVPTMKYGVLEIRARIPKGDWIWPAIWMMPKNDHYGQWPRSGEIDIMESRGNEGDVGVGTVTSTLHWGPSADQNRFMKTHGEKKTGSWFNDYHTWRLEWTPDHIITFVDNQQILNVDPGSGGFWQYGGFSGGNPWQGGGKLAPFDQDFYLILNVAVGGTSGFFPDGINYGAGVRKPWNNNSPKAAEEFWNAHNEWLPTWRGDDVAMLIDYVEFRYL